MLGPRTKLSSLLEELKRLPESGRPGFSYRVYEVRGNKSIEMQRAVEM